jgi:hypothetical protein
MAIALKALNRKVANRKETIITADINIAGQIKTIKTVPEAIPGHQQNNT